MEYLRQFPHLRARTNAFSALMRLRSSAVMAAHCYLQGKGYTNVQTPVLTSSDCEGAGELFMVEVKRGGREERKGGLFACMRVRVDYKPLL